MGWVKQPIHSTNKLFNEIVKTIGIWRGVPRGNGSAYEYLSDLIKDNYDVTLKQCTELCKMIAKHYGIQLYFK